MRPTDILKNEHRVIERVLDCLDKMADLFSKEGRVEAGPARDAIEFLRTFADKCHHHKEEERLFPLMESKGFSADAGPTAVMRNEHVQGRALIGRMDAAVDRDDVKEFADAARAYALLLRQHIEKEDHCLFPMADQALGSQENEDLLQAFERVEAHEIGVDVHRRCLRIADELAERYGVAAAQNSPTLDSSLTE